VKHNSDCIFCQIVAQTAPSFRVDEDELTYTFMDIFPVAPGHTLIITKEHFENIFETTPGALAAVARKSVDVAAAINRELAPEGLGVFQLNGAAAGQTVFHYHMHLIPRSGGDTLALHSRIRGADDELASIAQLLRTSLET
jgi:histidine triad (HIT) family protein